MSDETLEIALENAQVMRGAASVIDGIDMAITGTGWFGLVGANGSGKTTLLRAIAGRLPLQRGHIRIGGIDLSGDRAARAERVGFAVDPHVLPDELSPREIIALADRKSGYWDQAALAPLAEALKILPLMDHRCKTLSAGNRQRVAIYTAFLGLPRFVILDEPFNWLDPVVTVDLKDALSQLVVQQNILLITALHDLATLTTRCDRAGLLAKGQLVRTFDYEALRQAQRHPVRFEREIASILR